MSAAAQQVALSRCALTDIWVVAGRLAARMAAIGIATPSASRDPAPKLCASI